MCGCRPPTQAEISAWLVERRAASALADGTQPSPRPRGFVMDPNTGALKPAGLPLPTQVCRLSVVVVLSCKAALPSPCQADWRLDCPLRI